MCPQGVKLIGKIALTVVPNGDVESLTIYYKYANALHWFRVRTLGFLRESPARHKFSVTKQ
jgi:hypothetical protein